MRFGKIKALVVVAALASLVALCGCTQSSSQSNSSTSASDNTQISAADTTASSGSASAQSSSSAASSAASSSAALSSDEAASSSEQAPKPEELEVDAPEDPSEDVSDDPDDEGPEPVNPDEQLVTGTVVCTTFQERADEVDFGGSDFNSGDMLTLLVLDSPIEVTAYKGGGDYTGSVSVIRLPDDEMFRQFKDESITIGVDSWGAFPADLSAALYDLVLTFDDGLVLAAY